MAAGRERSALRHPVADLRAFELVDVAVVGLPGGALERRFWMLHVGECIRTTQSRAIRFRNSRRAVAVGESLASARAPARIIPG
jgi:hypothetical protein